MEDFLITLLAIIITVTPFLLLTKLDLKLEDKAKRKKKKIFILKDNRDSRTREEIIKLTKMRRLEALIRNRKS